MLLHDTRQISGRTVAVETIKRRPISDVFTSMVKTVSGAANGNSQTAETPHQKVFRLIGERRFEEAAKQAARLINAGDVEGFFIYGTTPAYRRADAWFHDTVGLAKRSALTEIHNITPELAQVLLRNNDGNRRVNPTNLAQIMRDIASDRWEMNGESIIVSKDGRVNDGQHRNFGILLTGKPIKVVMAFGMSRDSMRTVDIGVKRVAADRLAVAGVHDYTRMSAIAAMAFETYEGRVATPAEADDYFHANRALIEQAAGLSGSSMKGVGPSAAGVAAMHLLRMGHKPADIKTFFSSVRSGEEMKARDPRMRLHRAIFNEKYKLKLSRDNWLRAFVHHFIAWKNGEQMAAVVFDADLPEVK